MNGDSYTAKQAAWMRLRGLVRKETLQIVRDPSSIGIAFVMPVLLLLLFGYGVTLDAKHVRLGLVVEAPDAATHSLVAAFGQSTYFAAQSYRDIQQAERDLQARRLDGIVWLRSDFTHRLLSANSGVSAEIGVLLNGVDANQARVTEGYLFGVWQQWLLRFAVENGLSSQLPLIVEPRIWFNPAVRSRNFLVPGLIAVIMTLIGALLTALVVAREWERGTMEALLVTPMRIREFLLGKLAPYFVLGMGGMLLTVAMAVWLFAVPLQGSLWVLLLTSALFMFASLGMGLLISIIARSQFVAGQVAIIVTFLPAFILSGFIFDIGSMPTAIQWLTHLVPARYFVAILQTVFLAGDVWVVILPNALALLLMAAFFLGMVRYKASKRLE
jgi:ABC-2 type transport system permease protein